MALKDIMGQERAIKILQCCIAKKRIPHAMLFAGDEGIGKKLTAINFAKILNCHGAENLTHNNDRFLFGAEENGNVSDAQSGVDSCDQCPSCIKINKLFHPDTLITSEDNEQALKEKIYISHPDVALVMPYKDEIRVKVIRKLEEALSYKPFEGNYKVAIIDNAETMNGEAANAFLDTLEAPPSQSILILISSRPDMLLPTIRSRCQRISFTPLPVYKMTDVLQKKFKDIDHERSLLLSTLSGGKLGYALNEDLIAQRDRSLSILQLMLNRFEEDSRDNKISIEEWFDWVQVWLRDMAVFKATGRADLLINKDRGGEIKDLSDTAGLKDILKLARELYNIRTNLKFNLNEKLTLNYTSLLMRKRLGKT